MRPPKGFEAEKYPLRHRLIHNFGLSLGSENKNTALIPIVMSSKDTPNALSTVIVNPHNTAYVEDAGPLCRDMSIIDRMSITLRFSMTTHCTPAHLSSGTAGPNFDDGVYTGDDVNAIRFLWRPIFNVYPEKLDAADDDTANTVAAILGLTKDATQEDIVPLTTTKLNAVGPGNLSLPISTVHDTQVFGDYNMTTNMGMEDHVFDESLLQSALRRFTNKGALRSCLGRTRHVTLTRDRNPFKIFHINKFVPRAIRRIQPFGFFAIQVHLLLDSDHDQFSFATDKSSSVNHLGISMTTHYHEWNFEFIQDRGTPA